MHSSIAVFFLGDPTNHGSNVGAVALFAMGIFVLIGLIVFLITRRGRRPRQRPGGPPQASEGQDQAEERRPATDAKVQ